MNRSILAYSLAVALCYGGAYWVGTNETPVETEGSVVILPGKADDIEAVDFASKTLDVTMTVEKDELGQFVWVKTHPKPSSDADTASAADAPADADPHAPKPSPAEEPSEPAEFKAGRAVDAVLSGLAPFVAKRALDDVDPEQLEDLELGEDATRLTLRRRGKEPKAYLIGANVYGGANYYVQDPESGKVYIVDAAVLRPLFSGSRSLPETVLFDAAIKDIRRIDVQAGDARASFEQHHPDDPQAQFWAREGASEPDPAAAAWIEKAMRLRASAYVPADEHPASVEEAFSFVVNSKEPVRIVVFRAFDEEGEEQWFAESGFTRGLVRLHPSMAAEATADLSSALGIGSPVTPSAPGGATKRGEVPAQASANLEGAAREAVPGTSSEAKASPIAPAAAGPAPEGVAKTPPPLGRATDEGAKSAKASSARVDDAEVKAAATAKVADSVDGGAK